MDYLIYIEQKAEWAQFFCWYCDYVQRWSLLLPRQKLMSPVWDPDRDKEKDPKRSKPSIHKRSESAKLSKILTIMEINAAIEGSDSGEEGPEPTVADSACGVETPRDWQPCTCSYPLYCLSTVGHS